MTELLDKDTDLPISAGEDDMRQFLREIRTYPRLTAEEEKELARTFENLERIWDEYDVYEKQVEKR